MSTPKPAQQAVSPAQLRGARVMNALFVLTALGAALPRGVGAQETKASFTGNGLSCTVTGRTPEVTKRVIEAVPGCVGDTDFLIGEVDPSTGQAQVGADGVKIYALKQCLNEKAGTQAFDMRCGPDPAAVTAKRARMSGQEKHNRKQGNRETVHAHTKPISKQQARSAA